MRIIVFTLSLLSMLSFLSGCTTVRFTSQAAKGQWHMQHSGISLKEALTDSDIPLNHRELLQYIPAMKAYAETHGLKATKNYTEFVQIEGAAVSWVVTACPPLSLEPKTWSFPIAGSFTYLGWFHEKSAQRHASTLRRKGYDVKVNGASAYSTLGHFKDPVVSTMFESGPDRIGQLADTLFHESAHATIYLSNQSYFNESVAQFIGTQLAIDYQKQTLGIDSESYRTFMEREKYVTSYRETCHEAYQQLSKIYTSSIADQEKNEKKKALMDFLQQKLHLKELPNNAFLAGFKTYHAETNAFDILFEKYDYEWQPFISRLSELTTDDFPKPHTKELEEILGELEK
jgi:predicted aminopeptidase